MKKHLLIITAFVLHFFALHAQSTLLFSEDFEITNGFLLNNGGPGIPSGNNKWIVNNNYTGLPTYTNTMSQDSTYGGNITFAPHSKYLHIYDNGSGITNANFDATNASDNFAYQTTGLCTMGMDSVKFNFFYLCEGSATAYGQVYYSINYGAWIQTGQAQYNNKYKWQYESITSTAFANKSNVRFGFRWINDAGTPPSNQSFSVDDIDIIGVFTNTPITITVDSVTPNPVCQASNLNIHWHMSDTLCDGSYTIELSTAAGVFPGPNAWIYNVYYPQTSGVIPITLPATVTTAPCYKIRINRTTPFPAITGTPSACISVIACANTITTNQPAVTHDTNAVCIGSAIDVPFYSTGVYTANTYYAQLSDASGNFPVIPNIIGSLVSSATYSASLPPYLPGSVSGIIPNVPPGCNYYIRVVSTSPIAAVTNWGPFCIGQCDINTNSHQDLHFCVTDCAVSPAGSDTTITVVVHSYNNTAVYNPGNVFTTQLLSSSTFAHIGANGIFGSVTATSDTTLDIHIPCRDSLAILGIPLGMNYMRVVATNSSQGDDALGTLIRVTIGGTHAVGPTCTSYDYTTFAIQDTFCMGDQVYPTFSPFNYLDYSSYTWIISGYNNGAPFQNAQGANSNNTGFVFTFNPGTITMQVRETNNGCVGPYGPLSNIVVTSAPTPMSIAGPTPVCQGDTNIYHASYFPGTYYTWSNTGGNVVSNINDTIEMTYPNTGTFQLHINAINQCGSSSYTKNVNVNAYPPTPVITVVGNVLTSSSALSNTWFLNGSLIPGAHSQTYTYTTPGVYTVEVTSGGCTSVSLPYNTTGIDELFTDNYVSVYPNPFTTQTTISFATDGKRTIKIMNLLGDEVVGNWSLTSSRSIIIDMSGQAKGIYFVEVTNLMGQVVRKKMVVGN